MNMELRIPPSRLERHIRLLPRAYPPGYRADRGEEMLGTLLETTPDGQNWPLARDSWSLLAGGLRARRTSNRQPGPTTSLRQAVSLAVLAYYWYSYWAFAGIRQPPMPLVLPDVFVLLAIPALAWLATDARPALGVALASFVSQAVPLAATMQLYIATRQPVASIVQWNGTNIGKLALAVVLTVAMAWLVRRRTRPHLR